MRLAILDYGLFEVYANGRRIGIPGYYIESGDRRILVDTGFHRDYLTDPLGVCLADGLGEFGRLIAYPDMQNPTAQLGLLGISPSDITDLVLTHGHVDHVGRIDEFPQATLYVSAVERARPTPIYWNGQSRIAWPANQTVTVDAATDIVPGVCLTPTPGHTMGHLSLVLTLPAYGTVILAADAISRPDELADDRYADAEDARAARQSAQMLRQRAIQDAAWLVYGHCPQQWQSMRRAPYWYT